MKTITFPDDVTSVLRDAYAMAASAVLIALSGAKVEHSDSPDRMAREACRVEMENTLTEDPALFEKTYLQGFHAGYTDTSTHLHKHPAYQRLQFLTPQERWNMSYELADAYLDILHKRIEKQLRGRD